ITGCNIKVPAAVSGGSASSHPDAAPIAVRSRVVNGLPDQTAGIVSDYPAMIGISIFMGCPHNVYDSVDQCQGGPLIFHLRIEWHAAGGGTIARAGHG